jgi:hypothetical protein
LILIVFFVIEGVASIMFALGHKRELSGRWGWMLASGIIDLILAAIIFAGLPGTAALGDRAAGRHQYGVRRLGADRDGAVYPRDRSAFGCPGALGKAALIGKNLIQETFRGARVPRRSAIHQAQPLIWPPTRSGAPSAPPCPALAAPVAPAAVHSLLWPMCVWY